MPPRICKHTPSSNNNNLKKPCLNPPLLTLLFLFQMICFATSALILTMRNHHNNNQNQHRTPMLHANQSSCSLFVGSWIRDSSNYPLYDYSNCQFIDPDFNCQLYGRPDSDYLRYRWQPLNCDLPRFNGVEFLTKMRGKTVMLVGDSLGRNQYESLVCMIASGVPHSSIQSSKGLPLSSVKFLEYGVTVSYYKAPYLVDIDVYAGKKVLRLDEISGNANAWRDVDVLLFNTGHWWTHVGASQGWQYMESGGSYYQDMDRMVAMEKALKTWSKWVDSNIDSSTTRLFFLSISPTHDNPSEWTAGATTTTSKNCYGETAPMNSGTTYPQTYTDQMRIIDSVITNMHTPVYLLDITMLSGLRKDCHPSIYSGELNPQQRVNPGRSDCSHWCLPGLPDTWNQLLYTAMFY